MKTAIIYATKHGTTENVASNIADKLSSAHEVELISLRKISKPTLSDFEIVILGTPIYAGKASKKMKSFCKAYETILLKKKIGLYVCGMHPSREKQETELKEAYPEHLLNNASAIGFMGGEFLFEKMNLFERLIIKKIAKTNISVHWINFKEIDNFVSAILE
ncbi:MAG: flavodoxin domain-containing protein [Marinilabiliaceae bacterium]|nr:flavodoxin domain-containing protein [Marinilabiliaceae bacterium]